MRGRPFSDEACVEHESLGGWVVWRVRSYIALPQVFFSMGYTGFCGVSVTMMMMMVVMMWTVWIG